MEMGADQQTQRMPSGRSATNLFITCGVTGCTQHRQDRPGGNAFEYKAPFSVEQEGFSCVPARDGCIRFSFGRITFDLVIQIEAHNGTFSGSTSASVTN